MSLLRPRNAFSPRFYMGAGAFANWVSKFYFRSRLRGVERIPAAPCLFVGNHSALGNAEVFCLLGAWRNEFGAGRVPRGLMHDVGLSLPLVGHFWRAIGAVRASRAAGAGALRSGLDVIVFPGGDLDACRAFYLPRSVIFGARRGYVKLALEAGVPVVPIATIGSHFTCLMAPGGRLLARLPGVRQLFRTECVPLPMLPIMGVTLAIFAIAHGVSPALAVSLAVLSLLPLPCRITSEVLAPIDLATETSAHADPSTRIARGHELIHGALQRAVTTMQHG